MTKKNNRFVATLINIIGMGVALTVFMTLMVRVLWDWTYDRNFPEHEKVFRIEHNLIDGGDFWAYSSRPLIESVRTAGPNVQSVATCGFPEGVLCNLEETPDEKVFLHNMAVEGTLFDIFGVEFLEGSPEDFDKKDCIALSETSAKKLFGSENPVGKLMFLNGYSIEVAGVFKDLPKNCIICKDTFTSLKDRDITNKYEWAYYAYVKLEDPKLIDETTRLAFDKFVELYSEEAAVGDEVDELRKSFRLVNLHEAYFEKDLTAELRGGDKIMTLSFLSLALLIIIIAIINFINFSFARIPFRIKSINTRKVLGSSRGALIMQEILSAVLTATVSFILALVLFRMVSGTPFAGYVLGSMKIMDNLWLIAGSYALTILIACVAGLIPAMYATSQPTAMVLKGSYFSSVKGRWLRSVLIGLQFVLSFAFIIMSLFMDVQIKYLINKDMGFKTDNILQVACGFRAGDRREAFEEKLKQNACIKDVTFSDGPLLADLRMSWSFDYEDGRGLTKVFPVTPDFASFFGIDIVDGRDFSDADDLSPHGAVIANESFCRLYPNLKTGSPFRGANSTTSIIGICKDFNFQSAALQITPIILYNWGMDGWRSFNTAYVKLSSDNPEEAIRYIKKTVCEFDQTFSENTVDVRFMDNKIEELYKDTTQIRKLVTAASLIALLIAIIGIIGLVYFDTQFLSREIAVRRVNGASVTGILAMINKSYIRLCAISFLIACPIVFAVIRFWRSNFYCQAAVPAWIFAAALVVVVVVTVAVVTIQSWSAANANPVNSLKNE